MMETFYYQYDLNTIKSYFWGENIRNPGIRIRQGFITTHLRSCTRPTDLICIAIRNDHLDDTNKNRLREFGWRILEI